MPYITVGSTSQLQLSIPTKNTTNWSETMRTSTWNKISTHDHSGANGMGVAISTSALAADSVTGAKIRLDNNEYLKGRNFANSGNISIIKVNTSDTLTLGATLANPTLTTPTLGAATATSINKITLTAPASGATLTLVDGSSLITVGAYALTLTSSADSNATLPAGTNTLYSTKSGSITSAQLLASLSDETGTGTAVFNTSPTLVTPVLGAATATSINKLTLTAPATGATFTLVDGSSLITVGAFALTLTSTATSNATIPAGTNTLYSTKSGSITSAQLLTSLTDASGTGTVAYTTSPTFVTPTLGVATATSINKLTLTAPASSATLTLIDGSSLITAGAFALTLTSTATSNATIPSGSNTLYSTKSGSITSAQLLTSLTDASGTGTVAYTTSPTFTTPVLGTATATKINKLTLTTPSTGATLTLADNSSLITTGANAVTFATGGTATITLPTTSQTLVSTGNFAAKGDLLVGTGSNTFATLTVGANGQVPVADSTQTAGIRWDAAVSGGINYITNYDFEGNNVTGYITYADAAATVPVDMTGGSPASTFAANASSPLRGTYDALWTKSANNRQSEGWSYAYTQSAADFSSVIKVSFDYITSSAYVDGDMAVFVYDVTNSALIYLTPQNILGNTVAGHFSSYFQTSATGTSYRIGCHTTSTNAAAYTVHFDNFKVGPEARTFGTAINDWTAWPPTGTWSSNTTYTGWYRRVGDSLDMIVKIALAGAPTSASLTFTLPNSYVIDTLKLPGTPTNQVLGQLTGNSAAHPFSGVLIYGSTTTVGAFYTNDGSTASIMAYTAITQAAPYTFANNDFIYMKLEGVPITGWSSTSLVSSDADTRVVVARYETAAADSIANSGSTLVNFATKVIDTHGAVTTGASWKFTAPVSGFYVVSANNGYASATYAAGNALFGALYKNGVANTYYGYHTIEAIIASNKYTGVLSTIVSLNIGDYVDVRLSNNRTAGATNLSGTAAENYICVERISGPSSIAANELVAAKFGNTAGTTISTVAVVPFVVVNFDTHGLSSGTGTSWIYTVAAAGKYQIDCGAQTASTAFTAGDALAIDLFKNASIETRLARRTADRTASFALNASGGAIVSCAVGDTITIKMTSTTSCLLDTTAGYNYLSIHRIGF